MGQVFVDTSGFKAYMDTQDAHHREAADVFKRLKKTKITLATSNYILDESYTLLRQRRGIWMAERFREILTKSTAAMYIVRVTVADEKEAWQWFKRDWKDISFTDCVSFAVMKRIGIQRAVTFDQHFLWAGFTIET